MGYDLHITRKTQWFDDDGPTISPEEWVSLLGSDPELSRVTDTDDDTLAGAWNGKPLFRFADGEVCCKNADPFTIRKMVAMAERLNATLQGDDGEIYRQDGTSFQAETIAPAQPSLLGRIASWFRHRRNAREMPAAAPVFRAGQRVKNPLGDQGTVVSVDRNANAGMGRVRIRLDDGREQTWSYLASGLDIVSGAADA